MKQTRRGRQAGFGLIELVLAGFLAFTLLGMAGYLCKKQVQGYLDIRDQANIQAGVKKALQAMIRQISSAGGALADPLDHFSAQTGRFTFAYVDLGGNLCAPEAKTIISFYTKPGKSEDALMQDIDCGTGKIQSRKLASVPTGGLGLSFRYLDKNGITTIQPKKIKAVELDLKLQTGKAKAGVRMRKTREQIVRVQCVNL
jgi:Tfp pilus assembly protein PilV